MVFLDFEENIAALEAELAEIRHDGGNPAAEERLRRKIDRETDLLYARLTPWQKTLVARHPGRPAAAEVVSALGHPFVELHGDRAGGDDPLTPCGIGRLGGRGSVLIGLDRPREPAAPVPDSARRLCKIVRLLRLAGRFRLPVVLIADDPGGDAPAPGPLAEALCLLAEIKVPVISVALGALSGSLSTLLMCADVVLMLEHAIWSVADPEAAASALWPEGRDSPRQAADALALTAERLKEMGFVDDLILEPRGGAHRDSAAAVKEIGFAVLARLDVLAQAEGGVLRAKRRERLTAFGRGGGGR